MATYLLIVAIAVILRWLFKTEQALGFAREDIWYLQNKVQALEEKVAELEIWREMES